MSPPVPMHILLHQCWTQRLHQCCQYCGEINVPSSAPTNNRIRASIHPYQRQQPQQHYPTRTENENNHMNLTNTDEMMARNDNLQR